MRETDCCHGDAQQLVDKSPQQVDSRETVTTTESEEEGGPNMQMFSVGPAVLHTEADRGADHRHKVVSVWQRLSLGSGKQA